MNDKAIKFIEALPISRVCGFSGLAVFTHAYHESAGFTRVIGDHNYWGIKVPQRWKGKTRDVQTHEYIKGKKIAVLARFIDFETIQEALDWYMGLIERLYPDSFRNRQDAEAYFRGLVSGRYKYATDPTYVDKLIRLSKQIEAMPGIAQKIVSPTTQET